MWIIAATILAGAVASPAIEVDTLAGKPIAGRLVELDSRQVVVETPAGRKAVPLAGVLGFGPPAVPPAPLHAARVIAHVEPAGGTVLGVWHMDITGSIARLTTGKAAETWLPVRSIAGIRRAGTPPPVAVVLADGSVLAAEDYRSKGGTAEISLEGGGKASLSTRSVRSVRLKRQTGEIATAWAGITASGASADLIAIRKGRRLDFLEGVVREVGETSIRMDFDGQLIPIPRAKVDGIIYYHPAGAERPAVRCIVLDGEGSRFAARDVSLAGAGIKITTPGGLKVTRKPSDIRYVDFSQGKVRYLSDMKPESVETQPFFGLGDPRGAAGGLFGPRMDRALVRREHAADTGQLQIAAKVKSPGDDVLTVTRSYAKGLALHSRTEMVYVLPPGFVRFKATAGIDARVADAGHVRLVVSADGRSLFDSAVTGGDDPVELDLDIAGARRLKILVDYGEDLDVSDHLNLCSARIVK